MRSVVMLWGLALALFAAAAAAILDSGLPVVRADDDHGDYRSEATPFEVGAGSVSGAIDPTTILFDVDYFSFEARRGVRYTFVLEMITVEDANILVLNSVDRGAGISPGQTLTSGDGRKTIQWIARTTDTYFIEVSGAREGLNGPVFLGTYALSATGDTSLEDRHSDDRNGATPIEPDNVYQGGISPWTNQPGLTGSNHGGDDHDFFYFQASRGVKYTVDVELGTAVGIDIAIVKPTGGTEVTSGGVGTSLEWISPATAPYYIDLSGSSKFRDSIGTYSLRLTADTSLEDRHSQGHTGATALSFGNAHPGAVSPEDDRDVFSFVAGRGVRYSLSADLGTAQGIELSVEDANGDLAVSNNGVGTDVEWVAPAVGVYYVVVSGSSQVRDPVGTYSLIVNADTALEDRHSETRNDATPISFGSEHRGAVSPANDVDYFEFPAKRGAVYSIGVTLGTVKGVDMSVVNPDGGTEASNGGVGSSIVWTAPASQSYFIAIAAPAQADEPIGTYSLNVEANIDMEDRHGETRENATPITIGSSYQSAISPVGDSDYFTFKARRGVKYAFELTYGTATAVSLAVDSAGGGPGTSARNYGEGTDVVWIAPDSDDYFVAISGSPKVEDPTGTYWLRVYADTDLEDRHADDRAQATQIVAGNAIAGALSPPDDQDYFFFDAEQGREYTVAVELGTAEALRIDVIHDLAGFTTSNYGVGTTLQWTAPITGRYIIAVSGSTEVSDPVGTYQLTLVLGPAAAVPTPTPTPVPPTPTPAPTPSAPPEGPALIVGSRTAAPLSTVRVPVLLERAQNLSSLGFNLNYDPSVVEVVDVLKGSRLSAATFSYDTGVPGVVRLGFASTTGLSSGGSAAVVVFRALGEEGDASQLTLSEILASDSAGGRLPLYLEAGELTVGQPMAGDGNGDGKITPLDALIAMRMSAQLEAEDPVMDVSGDGRVTSEDARQILAMARPG